MTTITRDRNKGILLLNGAPAVLRGGAYDLFYNPKNSVKALAYKNTEDPVHVQYPTGQSPCQSPQNQAILVDLALWHEGANSFVEFFSSMQAFHCNFLRVFLSGGTIRSGNTLVSMSPFQSRLGTDNRFRYDVRGAVEHAGWNDDYFNRLAAFVAAADNAGVVVQLSLFNYYDLVNDLNDPAAEFQTWTASPWNADNMLIKNPDDATWADQHLLAGDLPQPNRHVQFVKPVNALRAVQSAFIYRVIQSVSARRNVVLELMNEPHHIVDDSDLKRVADFDSFMTGKIMAHRTSLRSQALISVNASVLDDGTTDKTDLLSWSSQGLPYFDEPDIVSYHALAALPNVKVNVCGKDTEVERVDADSVGKRADLHVAATPFKALLYSTDAVKSAPFIHHYQHKPLDMQLRDGQIVCEPDKDWPDVQRVCSYVYHWVKWCLVGNVNADLGRYHFHNHSTFKEGNQKIARAVADLRLT